MRTYECVIRRRHRMGMEIAACGPMCWSAASDAFEFVWTIPDGFEPDPVLIVQVDAYNGDDWVGHVATMRWFRPGDEYRVQFRPRRGDDDVGDDRADDPMPPGLVIDFDLDDLLRKRDTALV